MNKSIKKCCICSNSETGEFIMIGDNKYHLSCIEKMQKEKQEIKEQLEDMTLCRDIASGHRKEVQDRETILLNQQKKFIEYLEDRIKFWKDKIFENAITESDWTLTLWRNKLGILEESLSKYKESIGGKNGN